MNARKERSTYLTFKDWRYGPRIRARDGECSSIESGSVQEAIFGRGNEFAIVRNVADVRFQNKFNALIRFDELSPFKRGNAWDYIIFPFHLA